MLNGWTQSSENWTILKTNDTIVQYNFHKEDLANLRFYILSLQEYKSLYDIDENIIIRQYNQIQNYKSLVSGKEEIILNPDKIVKETNSINSDLIKQVNKYKKKSQKWPYWLGGGFIGGIVLCLSVK